MSYHCSLSAIKIPRSGKINRKFFIPPPRKIFPIRWKSLDEMFREIGFYPGEWKVSTNQYGHIQGLPHIEGVIVARSKSKGLLWSPSSGKVRVINGANFIGHIEEETDEN